MNRANDARSLSIFLFTFIAVSATRAVTQPTPQATAAYNAYIAAVEARLTQQHPSRPTVMDPGSLQITRVIEPGLSASFPGALLHHWRGTAFIPAAHAADFEHLLRDFNAYPQRFAPQVLRAHASTQPNGHLLATLRVRQKHVLTVVLDSTYDVTFSQLKAQQGSSASRSTAIYEIDSPGTPREHALSPAEEHGFLWRLNTYWTWQERDGGLSIQIESVSLSRDIPAGLGWALQPFVESVPRASLEFTLRSACNALRSNQPLSNSR